MSKGFAPNFIPTAEEEKAFLEFLNKASVIRERKGSFEGSPTLKKLVENRVVNPTDEFCAKHIKETAAELSAWTNQSSQSALLIVSITLEIDGNLFLVEMKQLVERNSFPAGTSLLP